MHVTRTASGEYTTRMANGRTCCRSNEIRNMCSTCRELLGVGRDYVASTPHTLVVGLAALADTVDPPPKFSDALRSAAAPDDQQIFRQPAPAAAAPLAVPRRDGVAPPPSLVQIIQAERTR